MTARSIADKGDCPKQHGRDQGYGIGFEQVGGHAGAVADVVTDVVGDDRRVARVILGNAGLDLAHQVSADVGALGEDAAAETGKDGDQRATEAEAHQLADHVFDRGTRHELLQNQIVAGNTQQAESYHQHAGDGAALEGNVKRLFDAAFGSFGSADIGADRDEHADKAGQTGEEGANGKANSGFCPERGRTEQ